MNSYWFIFVKGDILLQKLQDNQYTIPCSEEPPVPLKTWTHVMEVAPMDDGTAVKAASIDYSVTDQPQYEMCGLRKSYYKLSSALYLKAGKCQELLYWDHNTKYCGVCGAPMQMHSIISKRCTECAKRYGHN